MSDDLSICPDCGGNFPQDDVEEGDTAAFDSNEVGRIYRILYHGEPLPSPSELAEIAERIVTEEQLESATSWDPVGQDIPFDWFGHHTGTIAAAALHRLRHSNRVRSRA